MRISEKCVWSFKLISQAVWQKEFCQANAKQNTFPWIASLMQWMNVPWMFLAVLSLSDAPLSLSVK